LAGPFDLKTFANVGGSNCPVDLVDKKIGVGSDGTITEAACLLVSAGVPQDCTICLREEECEDDHDKGSWLSWLGAEARLGKEECVEVNKYCTEATPDPATTQSQPGFLCYCGLPFLAECSRNQDCCSGFCSLTTSLCEFD
jgi:hypothetical protein